MNTSGEVADLMVKESIQITESAAKLAGLGAKNLAAIILALVKEDSKLQGRTALKNLLKSEKPLCILQITEKDLKRFQSEAKKYGVLFTAVKDKSNDSGFCDIIAKQDDITKLNYIIEKLGLNTGIIDKPDDTPEHNDTSGREPERAHTVPNKSKEPEETKEKAKKSQPRAADRPSERQYRATAYQKRKAEKKAPGRDEKPSVVKKVENIKTQQKNNRRTQDKKRNVQKMRTGNKQR